VQTCLDLRHWMPVRVRLIWYCTRVVWMNPGCPESTLEVICHHCFPPTQACENTWGIGRGQLQCQSCEWNYPIPSSNDLSDLNTDLSKGCVQWLVWLGNSRRIMFSRLAVSMNSRLLWDKWPSNISSCGPMDLINVSTNQCHPWSTHLRIQKNLPQSLPVSCPSLYR